MLNNVCFVGRLSAEPELKKTESGKSVVTVNIAVHNTKEDTVFIPVIFWNKQAEIMCQYCKKGKLISVQGFLKNSTYKDIQVLRVVGVQFHMLEPKEKQEENNIFK